MSQKQMWIAAGVVAAVIIIILLVRGGSDSDTNGTVSPTVTASASATGSASASGSPTITKAPTTLTYAKALELYDKTRIQLDTNCQAHPNRMVVRRGTTVMFDNRSAIARNMNLDGFKFYLPKYGFYTRQMMTAKTYLLDCGTSQNVAQIVVE